MTFWWEWLFVAFYVAVAVFSCVFAVRIWIGK